MKLFAEVCILEPEHTIKVVETLIENDCSVVIRANAYDKCNPTIFVVGYGEADIADDGHNVLDHFKSLLGKTGGDVTEAAKATRTPWTKWCRRSGCNSRSTYSTTRAVSDQLRRIFRRARVQDGD
jgi:hypothetical protein